MIHSPKSSTGLNIEMLRAPFADIAPTNISKAAPSELVFPGNHNQFEEFPRMRLQMLGMIFQNFPAQLPSLHETVNSCLEQGGHPVEAVQYAVLEAVRACMQEAAEMNAQYMQVVREYHAMHTKPQHYALGANSGPQEMIGFISHGTTAVVALMEAVPEVYADKHGDWPTKEKLRELIPECLNPMLSNMTRMQGDYAVRIERAMGMHHRHKRFAKPESRSYSFEADTLVLRDTEASEVLDVRSCVVQEVLEQGEPDIVRYHGCLAGLSRMPKNAGGNVFQYLQTLIAGLLEQYWYDRVTRP